MDELIRPAGRGRRALALSWSWAMVAWLGCLQGCQSKPDQVADPLLGAWLTTSIVSHDGTTVYPSDMIVTFSKSGVMDIRLGAMGTTASRYSVLRHERHATILKVVTNGAAAEASVEFLHPGGISMITGGTTMFMNHLDPTALARHVDPPKPPLTAYQRLGQAPAAPGTISGRMNGQPWKLLATPANLLQDGQTWRINLMAEPPRDDAYETMPQLLISVPRTLGRRIFSDAFNVTFFIPPSVNVACGNGYLEVLSISEQQVVVAINAYLNENNHLTGTCSFDPRTVPSP